MIDTIAIEHRRARKTRTPWLLAAAVVGALVVSTPALAVVIVDTYTGHVLTNNQIALYYPGNSNDDYTGLFGAASQTGADIAGAAFTAVVTTNLALAPNVYVNPGTGDVGSAYATSSNSAAFSSVTVTINGHSVSWTENYGSPSLPTVVAEGGEFQEAALYREGVTCCSADTFAVQVVSDPRGTDFPDSVSTPGTYAIQESGDVINLFTIAVSNPAPTVYTRGFLAPTSLTVSTMAAPEPSAWVMLIAGVLGVGAALRRGRRRSGVVVA